MKNKREGGFTTLELLIALGVTTVSVLIFFMLIGDTIQVTQLTQKQHFSEELVDSYVGYFETVDVTNRNVYEFFTETSGREDLINNYTDNGGVLPKHFSDLEVICTNTPTMSSNENYIEFDMACQIDDTPVNNGNSYIVKRYVRELPTSDG